ncbi:MAG TPA: hypothetical protein VGD68_16705 [Streptosporangiaceae bacterium]
MLTTVRDDAGRLGAGDRLNQAGELVWTAAAVNRPAALALRRRLTPDVPLNGT